MNSFHRSSNNYVKRNPMDELPYDFLVVVWIMEQNRKLKFWTDVDQSNVSPVAFGVTLYFCHV
jgi:hypothetical protein